MQHCIGGCLKVAAEEVERREKLSLRGHHLGILSGSKVAQCIGGTGPRTRRHIAASLCDHLLVLVNRRNRQNRSDLARRIANRFVHLLSPTPMLPHSSTHNTARPPRTMSIGRSPGAINRLFESMPICR